MLIIGVKVSGLKGGQIFCPSNYTEKKNFFVLKTFLT